MRCFLLRNCVVILCLAAGLFSGCAARREETEKIRDLEFTILNKEDIPGELKERIENKKEKPFRLTYADQEHLYIAEGYGTKPTSGYSVEVNALYETEDSVCFCTRLLGPEYGEEVTEASTWPYVAVQLETTEKDVRFP